MQAKTRQGTPPGAEHIPCLMLPSTFLDSRRWGFAVYRLVEKIALLGQVNRVVLMGRSGLDFIVMDVQGLLSWADSEITSFTQ
ncbi:hypothetical protein SADUNF_Sadunf10G0096400 [Salix dunnii]|uniref:Uncharacterized protein n=1 Tax=Salix dunnii TaxID=1413687 RepID=A0A835MYE7_9ROSI|nr:hypothetical protein SADUNF_Sadunf10G0096400 [Salix dunnii]